MYWVGILLFFLLTVVGILVFLKFLKRRSLFLFTKKGKHLHVIEILPIAIGKAIYLIELDEVLLVVGVWETGMRLLYQINDKEVVDRIKIKESAVGSEGIKFDEKFAFLKHQIEKLKKLR